MARLAGVKQAASVLGGSLARMEVEVNVGEGEGWGCIL